MTSLEKLEAIAQSDEEVRLPGKTHASKMITLNLVDRRRRRKRRALKGEHW